MIIAVVKSNYSGGPIGKTNRDERDARPPSQCGGGTTALKSDSDTDTTRMGPLPIVEDRRRLGNLLEPAATWSGSNLSTLHANAVSDPALNLGLYPVSSAVLDEVSNDGPGEPLLPEIRVRLQVTLDSGHRKIKHSTKSTSNSAHLQPESLVHRLRTQSPPTPRDSRVGRPSP